MNPAEFVPAGSRQSRCSGPDGSDGSDAARGGPMEEVRALRALFEFGEWSDGFDVLIGSANHANAVLFQTPDPK